MLVATDDPKRAIAYLDMARLLAPGTLVEEAALRREAVIAAGVEDLDKFKLLTSQYLRRYHKSFYAGDFIRRFAVVMMTGKYAESPALFQELAETLDTLDKEQRKLVYSAIAEAGIVRGRVQITLLAARKLADQAKDDPKRAVQARLYESAVLLVTDEYDRAAAQLKSIDRAQLAPRDQPLLDAALTVASRLRAAPEAAASDAPPPVSAEQGKDAELSQLPAVVGRANKAIVRVDELLDGDKR
jgi:chemotaxis protein MotC